MDRPVKRIAIYGTTPSRGEGPINSPDWEHWTIGPGGKDAHRWDRLYEMHNTWPADFNGYLNDLSLVKHPQAVVTFRPMALAAEAWARQHGGEKWETFLSDNIKGDWSANLVYPRDAILAKYGRRMWFSSSISWLIAQAIEEGATDIGLWGIDLESGEEYISQFVGCAHFIDLARLAGINVHMPAGCGLLRDPNPYPDRYETHLALTLEKKQKWLEGVLAENTRKYEEARITLYRREGVAMSIREAGASLEAIEKAERELLESSGLVSQLSAQINHINGELSATGYYRRMYMMGLHDPDELG